MVEGLLTGLVTQVMSGAQEDIDWDHFPTAPQQGLADRRSRATHDISCQGRGWRLRWELDP